MKEYSDITLKYIKNNKKRTILVIMGIVLSVVLFSSIMSVFLSYKDAKINSLKTSNGDYEVVYKNLHKAQVDRLIYNSEVSSFGVSKDLGQYEIINDDKKVLINISEYDENSFKDIFHTQFNIKQGRLPISKKEIILQSRVLYLLGNKKIDDYVTIEDGNTYEKKEYKIVGVYDDLFYSIVSGVTFIDKDILESEESYDVLVNLKERKDKVKIAHKLAEDLDIDSESISVNQELMGMKSDKWYLYLKVEFISMLLLFIIITICSFTLIYNTFNISIMERMSQLGILRAIGASPKQIRKIIFKEGFYIGLIAIPIGLILGYFGLDVILKLIGGSELIHINFYPKIILISSILSALTIFIAIYFPALRAGRLSPIKTIKEDKEFKVNKINRELGSVSIWGFEGELAYKNIKRMPKRFWITVSSLIISIILFITYGTYSRGSYINERNIPIEGEAIFSKDSGNFTETEYKEIESLNGIDKLYKIAPNPCAIIFPKEYKTDNSLILSENSKYVNGIGSTMSFYNEYELELAKKYLLEGDLNKEDLDNMGVILVKNDYSTYKVGDKLVIPKIKDYQYMERNRKEKSGEAIDDEELYSIKKAIDNKEFYTFNIVAIINEDFLMKGYTYDSGIGLVFSEKVYKKINGNLDSNKLLIKYEDDSVRENLYYFLNEKASEIGGKYTDYSKQIQELKFEKLRGEVFIYTVIVLITFIGAMNIANSIGTSVVLRYREFATLRALGMTMGQLKNMILIEGAIYAIVSSFIGGILGGGLGRLLNLSESKSSDKFPYEVFVIAIIGTLMITLTASIIPLSKIKNNNIIDSMREN